MEILFLIIPLAILIAIGFVLAFIWATKNGQYDDLTTPAYTLLLEEEEDKYRPTKESGNE